MNTETVKKAPASFRGKATIVDTTQKLWDRDPDEAIERYVTFERMYKRVVSILVDHPSDFQRESPGTWKLKRN